MMLREIAYRCLMVGPALVALAVSGCAVYGDKSLTSLTPTPATMPENDKEIVIAQALRRAVIEEKDIPGYDSLAVKDKIVILNEIGRGGSVEPLRPGALPESDNVDFVLLSRDQIKRLAFLKGDYMYLSVAWIRVDGNEAAIEVRLSWASSSRSKVAHLSGGAYTLIYLKRDGTWVFHRIDDYVIS